MTDRPSRRADVGDLRTLWKPPGLPAQPGRPRVLVLPTSRTPPGAAAAIQEGVRARIDYLDLRKRFDATVVDWSVYDHGPARAMARFDRLMRLAWGQAFQVLGHLHHFDVVYSMGEDVGLALAWLMRARGIRVRHVLISHNLLSPRKTPLIRALGVLPTFAAIVVMTRSAMGPIAETYKGVAERLVNLPNFVDERFWRPRATAAPTEGYILSVGRAKRDYDTLLRAIGGESVTLRVQASSQWHVTEGSLPTRLPPNVVLGNYLDPIGMRACYERSQFVVVPLRAGTHHFAGTETILEAMAMKRAVILAADQCPADYLVPGETGLYVPAGDVPALRQAVEALLRSPQRAAAMGEAGRRWIESHMSYDDSIRRLAELASPESGGPMGGPDSGVVTAGLARSG